MASSNVEYYEKQKQLQDVMTSCEQERMDLDRQLRIALQADQTSSKMKAARLHSYWKKICEDEKKAKQRNEMLVREFERIDAHMSEMNSRTMRLAHMKKQYEDYIARTYPKWNELMYGKPQSQSYMEEPQQVSQETVMQETVPQHPADSNSSHPSLHQEQPIASRQQSQAEPQHLPSSPSLQPVTPRGYPQPIEHNLHEESIQNERSESLHYSSNVTQQKAHVDQHPHSESGIYQNLPSARSESEKHIIPQNGNLQRNKEDSNIYQNEQSMSQPVQSVDIQSRSSGQRIQSSNYPMQPALEEEDEDEETSEFGTESEIPMAQSLQNTQIRANSMIKTDHHHSADDGVIKPELTIEGLLYLLSFMENDVAEAFSVDGYYRSSVPESTLKNDIVRKANSHTDLRRIDANHVSMVILEQITLIVRSLAEKCLIPETLLQENSSQLTPTKLRLHLSSEAQIVWDALFAHFVKLVRAQVMEATVLSAIFTPCLVVEGGSQDKAHTFIVQLLKGIEGGGPPPTLQQTNKSMSPAATMEGSGSFADDGNVPRLKFGSLLDKPSSDDESSYINSLPRDPVPLNETAAYKSMVSTGERSKPKQQTSLQEDTDDDVEKQIATALTKQPVKNQSPRKRMDIEDPSETSSQTLQSTPHVYVPTALEPKSPRRPLFNMKKSPVGVKISSDLDTDTEVDAAIFGSSRQPEDDFDFYD